MTIVSHQRNLSYKIFDYVYCSICEKDSVPMFLEKDKEKLPDNPKISDLIDNWYTVDVQLFRLSWVHHS